MRGVIRERIWAALGKIFLGKSGYSKENDTHFQYKHANVDGKIDNSLPTVLLHKHIGAYIRMHSSAYKWIECNSKSDVLYSKCISDGSGTRILDFWFWKSHGELSLRQVKKGFSSVYAKFFAYLIIDHSKACRGSCETVKNHQICEKKVGKK